MRKANGAFKAATAAAVVALMVVSACGSSTDEGGATTTTQDPTTEQTSETPDPTETTEPTDETPDPTEEPGGDIPKGDGQTVNVWMQGDTLKDIDIDALNAQFEEETGAKVNLQEQTWGEYTTKVLAGLADTSDQAPDVLELGNTQVAQFAAEGALLELDAADFENSDTWLKGLEESSTYDGKLIAVPYYAGVRVGIYRTDLAKEAGVEPPYATIDDLQKAAVTLREKFNNGNDAYSGLYFASQYWYAGMSFVWDFGGDIAKQNADGSWEGTFSSPESKAGLQRLKEFYDAVSRNSGDTDEGQDASLMAQEQTAMIIDPTWMPDVVTGGENGNPELEGKLGIFPVPGHQADKPMPQFLGGSDIAINAKTKNADLAKYYTKLLTGQKYQEVLASKGYIANSTSFEPPAGNEAAQVAVKAASTGRFVPSSKNWTSVEDARVLQNLFNDILTGAKSIDDAAAAADKELNDLLNAG